MSRNDPRMQRGLAVQRRMQEVGLAPGARKDTLRATLEKAHAAASEAARQRRASPEDRARYDAVGRELARINWLKANGHLPRDMPVQEAYRRVQEALPHLERMQAEQQATVERQQAAEASLLQLAQSPQDVALIRETYAAQGWPGVTELLRANGIHEDVIDVATSTIAASGGTLDGLGNAIAARLHSDHAAAVQGQKAAQAQAEAETARQRVIEQADPADPVGRILANPEVHRWAEGVSRTRAAELAKLGLARKPGESGAHWAIRVATSAGEDVSRLAAALGTDEATVRATVAQVNEAHLAHGAIERLGQRDGVRAPDATKAPAAEAPSARRPDDLRRTVEAAAKHAPKEKPIAVGNSLGATIAIAAGHDPRNVEAITSRGDRDIRAAAERLERPEPVTLRSTIEAAAAAEAEREPEDTEGETE